MSSVPDAPASTVIGRRLERQDDTAVVEMMIKGMLDNVREIIDMNRLWNMSLFR